MSIHRRGFMLELAAAAATAGAAGPAAAAGTFPVSVVDAIGRTVIIPHEPRRIIPLFSSNTELVAGLGLTKRIVGIDGMTHYPPAVVHLPQVGNRLGFSVEACADLRPDLLIVTPSRQAMNQLMDPMTRIGVPVAVLLSRNLNEIVQNFRLVGKMTGVPERGAQLADTFEARLRKVRDRLPAQGRPRTVLITGRAGEGLLLVARPNSYIWDAVQAAGGRWAFDRPLSIAQTSPEAILAADPDVLLFAGSQKDFDALIGRQGWREAKAVKQKRTFIVSRAEFTIPGPRTMDGVEKLAARLFPDRFPAMDKAA